MWYAGSVLIYQYDLLRFFQNRTYDISMKNKQIFMMSSVSVKSDMMKIAINKSLLKEYTTSSSSRTVYVDNGTEFQIQLFNPEKDDISARITIDGKSIGDDIVLRPGERLWLERYISSPRKFLFETYKVDGDDTLVQEAIRDNGLIRVEFRHRVRRRSYSPQVITYTDSINRVGSFATQDSMATCYYSSSSEPTCSAASSVSAATDSKIETGRVEEGDYSHQAFEYVDYEFEWSAFRTESIKIMPLSTKPTFSEDLKKRYCPRCGAKIKDTYKYCPCCGEKL